MTFRCGENLVQERCSECSLPFQAGAPRYRNMATDRAKCLACEGMVPMIEAEIKALFEPEGCN